MAAPRHVLLELDEQGDLHSVGEESDAEEPRDTRRETPDAPFDARTASSRFWGVSRNGNKWQAYYKDAAGKTRSLGLFENEEEAARRVNRAIRSAGLQGRRRTNAVDATGRLVPRERHSSHGRSAVVAPDPAREPTATSSKFWGVSWKQNDQVWLACYTDANSKTCYVGTYATQEAAAHAYNAAIRALPPDVQARRKTNPVVDGQLVPKPSRKRSRAEDPAAAPTRRSARRSRGRPAAGVRGGHERRRPALGAVHAARAAAVAARPRLDGL